MAKIKKFKDINRVNETMVYTKLTIEKAINNLFDELCIDHATDKQRELLLTAIKAICVLEGNTMYSDLEEPHLSDWNKQKDKIMVPNRQLPSFPSETALRLDKEEIQKAIKNYQEIEKKYAQYMDQHYN